MLSLVFFAASLLSQTRAAAIPSSKQLVARQYDSSNLYANWPSYSQLPLHPSFPTKAAWGVWGADDEYGALNHITNATILAAARENIQLGQAININLELDIPDPPVNPSRKPLQHLYQPEAGYTDDVLVFNSQISTQFDGLRHFPYSTDANTTTYQWYNDLIADYDEVIGPAPTTVLGIQMSAQKGIAGRGVLLDWAGWAESQNMTYDPFSAYTITVAQLDQVAVWQGLNTSWAKPGDMLFVRTGWTKAYNALNTYEQNILPYRNASDANWIGVIANDDTAEWLWEKKLALVGADNPAFESVPFNGTIDGTPRSLHQMFIGGNTKSPTDEL